jgi:hypothetical protein
MPDSGPRQPEAICRAELQRMVELCILRQGAVAMLKRMSQASSVTPLHPTAQPAPA